MLNATALRIDHIGSTAVPGLAAKPCVDIQVSVASLEPDQEYSRPLEEAGYLHRPDAEPEHRFFERPGFHVHVCRAGSAWERRHLAFRDHLREHADIAAEYERLKRGLAAILDDSGRYADAKTAFVREVERWASTRV